jgi:hypothetical protein
VVQGAGEACREVGLGRAHAHADVADVALRRPCAAENGGRSGRRGRRALDVERLDARAVAHLDLLRADARSGDHLAQRPFDVGHARERPPRRSRTADSIGTSLYARDTWPACKPATSASPKVRTDSMPPRRRASAARCPARRDAARGGKCGAGERHVVVAQLGDGAVEERGECGGRRRAGRLRLQPLAHGTPAHAAGAVEVGVTRVDRAPERVEIVALPARRGRAARGPCGRRERGAEECAALHAAAALPAASRAISAERYSSTSSVT